METTEELNLLKPSFIIIDLRKLLVIYIDLNY